MSLNLSFFNCQFRFLIELLDHHKVMSTDVIVVWRVSRWTFLGQWVSLPQRKRSNCAGWYQSTDWRRSPCAVAAATARPHHSQFVAALN